ncbi:MAG: MarC family protein [Gemmatimonadetes bacterium]|nr:MarC family protein [Gemmatimonadota bacterium]
MIPDLQELLYALAPLVALTNPVAEIPIFLAIVAGQSTRSQRAAAAETAFGVWLVLTAAVLLGRPLLASMGISLAAFRAAGGLLLALMGLEMTRGEEPALQSAATGQDEAKDRLWIPLVMPLLAGPGAIVTAISLSFRESADRSVPVATLIAVALSAVVVLMVLLSGPFLLQRSSLRTRRILTRFSGLVLVAIGFQMGFTSIAEFFNIAALP